MKKILSLHKFSKSDQKYLFNALKKYYDLKFPKKLNEKNLIKMVENVDVIIGYKVTENILKKSKKLKLIQCPGTGINLFDLNLLKKYNVKLANTHSASIYIAEYAISLLFSILKKIHHHDMLMRNGIWFKPTGHLSDQPLLSDTIFGKTIGIFGYGEIGKKIAEFCKGFGVKIIFTTNRKKKNSVKFEKLLSKSDIIFIAAPLTNLTKEIFNKNAFSLMKKDAYIINVSRAELVEEKALYDALIKKKISGAAIDLWANPYLIKDKIYPSSKFKFHHLKNIVLSPHRAGYVKNLSPHLIDVVNNLIRFKNDDEILNKINFDRAY